MIGRIEMVSVDELRPRMSFLRSSLGDLHEMADSIRSVGVLEPLIVDSDGGIICGERRWRAARLAGHDAVPCIRRRLTDGNAIVVALVENMQRRSIDPLGEAQGFKALVERGLTQREIARKAGCAQSHVAKRLALLKIGEAARERVVSQGVTKALRDVQTPRRKSVNRASQWREWLWSAEFDVTGAYRVLLAAIEQKEPDRYREAARLLDADPLLAPSARVFMALALAYRGNEAMALALGAGA